MSKIRTLASFCFGLAFLLIPSIGFTIGFPDKGGLLDFDQPSSISNQIFLLTNPKSGSHLLFNSIIAITKRPLRGRLPLKLFYEDPNCYPPENILKVELDFTKPTFYWGHEYYYLKSLNHGQNKLIFILRNYKENIISNVMLNYDLRSIEKDQKQIEKMLRHEIFNKGIIFKEYIERLETFDSWSKDDRCLVRFEDLALHPEYFVPQVLQFIEDDSDYEDFVIHYDEFKVALREQYDKKDKSTHSESNTRYFCNYISPLTLQQLDDFVELNYPSLWNKYLHTFKE